MKRLIAILCLMTSCAYAGDGWHLVDLDYARMSNRYAKAGMDADDSVFTNGDFIIYGSASVHSNASAWCSITWQCSAQPPAHWWASETINTSRLKHADVAREIFSGTFIDLSSGTRYDGDPRNDSRVRRAMQEYRMAHPVCEWDKGNVHVEVHHQLPVNLYPEFAGCKWNYICLCRKCHLSVGHAGSFKRYVPNVRDLCNRVMVVEKEQI